MRVLVIGSSAREHAFAQSLVRDPSVTSCAVAPGNAGTATVAEQLPLAHTTSRDSVVELARSWEADLVVVGPAEPLAAGVADALRAASIACFGPSASAARMEGSKSFAKDVMAATGVPTGYAENITTIAEFDKALAARKPPYVVKDDGLAGGKGVVVTMAAETARAHANQVLAAGRPVLLEDYLSGPELSLFTLVDGDCLVPLLPAQDFKRLGNDNTGPNTGGMGAYAPVPWISPQFVSDLIDRIVRPVVSELRRRGTPYSGALYTGLVITEDGPRVLEFNCRLGDPETQSILALLRTPLGQLLHCVATGRLAQAPELDWESGAAVTVILATSGYPGAPRQGDVITGADQDGVLLGLTRRQADGTLIAAGGRVLSVVGTGDSLAMARDAAYRKVAAIHLADAQYRTDIALNAASVEIG